jgi:hypothetical protein
MGKGFHPYKIFILKNWLNLLTKRPKPISLKFDVKYNVIPDIKANPFVGFGNFKLQNRLTPYQNS